MGVIWGEGMADHRPADDAGFRAYLDRLILAVRRWLFVHEGEE